MWLDYHIFLVITSLNFWLDFDKLFLVLIFFKQVYWCKSKIIDSFFVSDKREDIIEDKNNTNLLFSHIFKPDTRNSIVELENHLLSGKFHINYLELIIKKRYQIWEYPWKEMKLEKIISNEFPIKYNFKTIIF